MKALALLLGLLASQPAHAHCFRVWKYLTPQHCGGVYARAARPILAAVQKPDDDHVNIEITVTSELLETWARQDALDKMKGELK